MRNFFAYRLPGNDEIICGGSDRLLSAPEAGSFYVVPFDKKPSATFAIPADCKFAADILPRIISDAGFGELRYACPERSTTRGEHAAEIEAIQESIGGSQSRKVVASRAIVYEDGVDIFRSFKALCGERPDAFVFLFHTPESGTWLGASPELLLSSDGERLRTMSLAGTRKAGEAAEWSSKNSDEQSIVTRYILECMRSRRLEPEAAVPQTRRAGSVEHIMTPIEAPHPAAFGLNETRRLLDLMSPTPALCGFPVKDALEIISRYERFDRAWYGGYCGPVMSVREFSLFVILRSLWICGSKAVFFAGGGITDRSDIEEEWTETEKKAESVIKSIKFCHKNQNSASNI